MLKAAPQNLITDVDGIHVGNTHNEDIRTGVTVILPSTPAIAAIDVRGGGPGTRDTTLLDAEYLVERVHAVTLSGGSAFGLDAATGVQAYLREKEIGFPVGDVKIPIVPQAILFDMLNGGNKDWGKQPPFQELAYKACEQAGQTFQIGSSGAGYGATTVNYKGGLGSASLILPDGIQIGAIVAVNAAGSTTIGNTRHFWAAAYERDNEFGGLGFPETIPESALEPKLKGSTGQNTTIALVATNATLNQAQAKRFAIMAQTGLSQAIYPAHTPIDGDIVFALSTEKVPLQDPVRHLSQIGALAANTLARAIARAVYSAITFPNDATIPSYCGD